MPQATSRDSAKVTTAPNIAMLAADGRVRTLVAASTNARSGTSTMTGTAHGRVEAGSKRKPPAARAPDAAPEAAVNMSPRATSRLSESPPDRRAQSPRRPRKAPRSRARHPSPGPAPDAPLPHRTPQH